MDNSNKIRRKAQKLTQQGAYAEAVAEYGKLSDMGVLEPYDLVIFADLLNREGQKEDSVQRYLQAMDSYAESGLHRNAIALGKKVQRMAPDVVVAHRKLGDLYAMDGLASESCLHYLEFLERAKAGTSDEVRDIETVCKQLLDLSLPSFDIVHNIVEKARDVEMTDGLASSVLSQADRAAALGNTEAEAKLRELAHSLDPNAVSLNGAESAAQTLSVEPGLMELEGDLSADSAQPDSEEVPVLSLDDDAPPETTMVEDVFAPPAPGLMDDSLTPGASEEPSDKVEEPSAPQSIEMSMDDLAMESEPAESKVIEIPAEDLEEPVESKVIEIPAEDLEEPVESKVIEIPTEDLEEVVESKVIEIPTEDLEKLGEPEAETVISEDESLNTSSQNSVTHRARGLHALEINDPDTAQREFMKGAKIYFDEGQTQSAAELFELVVKIDPNHLEALEGLVEIAHINGERSKMARWGCELGDVLLSRGTYPEAKIQFERVLAFDKDSEKAKARLKRLNTMAGIKDANFGKLTAAPSEVKGAQVTIRDDEAEPQSQFTLNLGQILEEFRAAVVERIPAEDAQSHHDLGMTYMEMGLIEEASIEFETAASNEQDRFGSLEMLGECYLLLNRPEEGMKVFDELLAAVTDDPSKAQIHMNRGRAQEALGEWDLAEEDYHQALKLNEDLTEAAELLLDLERRREQGAA